MSILEEFACQVASRPDKVALVDDVRELTFTEVDAASDQLAHRLHALRQSDNDINGYLGPISTLSITTNLACFKSGQCIGALDPRHPVQVLADLIVHSKMARILVPPGQEALAAELKSTGAPQEFLTLEPPLRSEIPRFEPVDANPTSLSTIVFTSGSTGRPKDWQNPRQFLIDRWERNRASQFTPDDIGGSFWTFRWEDQLRMLCDGVRQECFDFGLKGPVLLAEWLNERKVTNFVGYMFLYRQMTAAAQKLPHVRKIFLLGEAIVRSDLETFNEKFSPGAELISRFGSSEYGAMTVYTHRQGSPVVHEILPIGKPIRPGTLFILDENGEEVLPGELGEVAFSTPLVPHGYLNDPERSVNVFKPDNVRPGNWRYHTGDLGYIDANGDVTLVGRREEQVKVRGYTVRPPDVEQMVVEHPGVDLAAVVPYEGRRNTLQLACFFTAKQDPPPTGRHLWQFLNARAPSYMVPVVYLQLPEMPLSPNGKIAKGRLPDPLDLIPDTLRALDDTNSLNEQRLAAIWREILGHGEFDLAEDFFDLGGDSLQAMTMLTAIEAAFKVKLPLESLILDGATVARLAERIDAMEASGLSNAPVMLKRGGRLPALFATRVVGGHLSDYLDLVGGLLADRPVHGLHPKGMDGREAPDASFTTQAEHCAASIKLHQPHGPYDLIGYSYGAKLALEVARVLVGQGGQHFSPDPDRSNPAKRRFAGAGEGDIPAIPGQGFRADAAAHRPNGSGDSRAAFGPAGH